MTMQMFSKKFNEMCKLQNYPTSHLGYFYNVDFEISDSKYMPDSRYEDFLQSIPADQRNSYADQHFNLCSEIQMTLVVVKDDK
jgi:hypothetical protein